MFNNTEKILNVFTFSNNHFSELCIKFNKLNVESYAFKNFMIRR
jgi:hypothetical protein